MLTSGTLRGHFGAICRLLSARSWTVVGVLLCLTASGCIKSNVNIELINMNEDPVWDQSNWDEAKWAP